MSIHMPGFQSFLVFLYHFLLAKLKGLVSINTGTTYWAYLKMFGKFLQLHRRAQVHLLFLLQLKLAGLKSKCEHMIA